MKSARLGRRPFLRGLGLGAAMLPFVPLLDVHADSAAPPRRLVFFFSTNGTVRESWLPSMTSGELVLGPILAPLEKFKSKLLVVDGLAHNVILEKGERSGHYAGINTALTGRSAKLVDSKYPLHTMGTGVSIDQYLAQKMAADTKLRSIECGVQVQQFASEGSSLSYRGPLQPIHADNNPYSVFDRLFTDFSARGAIQSPAALERLADRKSVLGAVKGNLETVGARLPQEDRIKMEAHLGAVSAIEQSLTTGVGDGAADACGKPDLRARIGIWNNENIPAVSRLQIDLLVMALACDLTRVGTIQYGRAGAQHRFTWLGPEFASDPALAVNDESKGFHALAHQELDPPSRAKLVKINAWYAGQLAYLLEKLASIPEAGGSMLDNTVVVWVNELGTGSHSHEQLPWVIAGNAHGFFKTGHLVSFPGQPHNRLLLTLAHAMGLADEVFGDPDFCSGGPLTGVTG